MRIFSIFLLWANLCISVQATGVCLMLYQMADNDLEIFIRQDNAELINSPAIQDPTLTTWVYFDGRNYDNVELARGVYQDGMPVITEPLPGVYNADGSSRTGTKEQGSLYMTFDHDLKKMTVQRSSLQELDGDDPNVVAGFVITAMENCIARSATEFVLIFSSHGSGAIFGFGGDKNSRQLTKEQQRRISQANSNLAAAISFALESVDGAPAKLDVIGFDACLMQALGALEEYHTLTKYYLASEAVEPGTGWSYYTLDKSDTALNMAIDFLNDFIDELQGFPDHQPPKTMAVVDTSKFPAFVAAWESLFAEMEILLTTDPQVSTLVRRARANAISFDSSVDAGSSQTPSALDIGSFFSTFRNLCQPNSGSSLNQLLIVAENAYKDMFVAQRNGEGTPPATGMHVLWPTKRTYQSTVIAGQFTLEQLLFDTNFNTVTKITPNFLSFLRRYYEYTGTATSGDSVCSSELEAPELPIEDGQLLVSPKIELFPERLDATTFITPGTDEVLIEYGVDLSHLLDSRFRHLQATVSNRGLAYNGVPDAQMSERSQRAQKRQNLSRKSGRRLQTNDYFILFGGDMLGNYNQATYEASWDLNFYLIGDDTEADFVYAYSFQGGLKSIPVYYFSSNNEVNKDNLPIAAQKEDAEALGGVFGLLTFSVTGDGIGESSALYTYDSSGRLSETPRTSTGNIVPVVFTEGVIRGNEIFVLVGGFFQTIIPWSESTTLIVESISAKAMLENLESNYAIVDFVAYDDDADQSSDFDFETFDITLEQLEIGSLGQPNEPGPGPSLGPSSSARTFAEKFAYLVGCCILLAYFGW